MADGGQVKFYPYENGGGEAEQVLAMLKGGTQSFGVVFTRKLEVLAILKRGAKRFHPLKVCVCVGGGANIFPYLERGGG